MKKNSKISVALHSLIHLIKADGPQTSEDLSKCLKTNPVVVRRIMSDLKKAGLVESEKGHGGGFIVIKSPKEITLLDVYTSLDESLLPRPIEIEKNESCLIIKTLSQTMDDFLAEANTLLNNKLKKISLEDISNQILAEFNV